MKKKKIIPAIIILLIVIVAGSCFWYFQYKKPHDEAVANFNKAVSALKESNKPLDEAVSSLKSVIDSKEEPWIQQHSPQQKVNYRMLKKLK